MKQEQQWMDMKRTLLTDEENGASVMLEMPYDKSGICADGWVRALWVDEPHRRQGVARKLMERAEVCAKEQGCKSVALSWNKAEAPRFALDWYKRLGYVVRGKNSGGTFLLRKELTPESEWNAKEWRMKEEQTDKQVVESYRMACWDLASRTYRRLFEDGRDFYWVGGDVGGVCNFGDNDYINAEDMARILETGMTFPEYEEWREANLFNGEEINLRSWLKGCRHSMLRNKGEKPE